MYYLLEATKITVGYTEIAIALITQIATVTIALINLKSNHKKDQKEKELQKVSNWKNNVVSNDEIKKRLGRIKHELNVERVSLIILHNGIADTKGNHLKRFSIHSYLNDEHLPFDASKWMNVQCSLYNDVFKCLIEDGGVEIYDTENSEHVLSNMYYEWGYKSAYLYPIIFDGIFWGFVAGMNMTVPSNHIGVDRMAINTNIDLIVKQIKSQPS